MRTPLPLYLFGSLSRSSSASLDPVLAPDGTDENALILLSSVMFTPTVGFPLESKISLATIYNTVHALTKKGHLKEVLINTNQSYFDTNIEHHHHMYDETKNELIDLNQDDINSVEIKRKIPGKKIKSIEVLVKITSVK